MSERDGQEVDRHATWVEHARELARTRPLPRRAEAALVVGSLLAVTLVNALWFSGFHFRTIMGDDLYAWAFYSQHPSFMDLLLAAPTGKYRPVLAAVQAVLFRVFSADYRAWVAFNIGFNLVNAFLLFALVRRLTRSSLLLPLVAALMYVTSRFSYYNILQVSGGMEALGLCFLLLILHVAISFMRRDARWPGFALAGLYFLVIFTHERYIVLLPFLLLLVAAKSGMPWRLKGLLGGLICAPAVLNVVVKSAALHIPFLMGTGGQTISFEPVQVVRFVAQGLANMLWINAGPDYLSGINITEMGPGPRILMILLAAPLASIVVLAGARLTRLSCPVERMAQIKGFALFGVLFVSLVLAASITIRQEYRWLYGPFIVCLVYFCYQVAMLPARVRLKRAVLIVLALLAVGADFYYQQHEGNVFFVYGEKIADSTYDATVGHYGLGMSERTVYVEKTRDIEWILGGNLFLAPYLGTNYHKIVWVDDLDTLDPRSIDLAHSVFLRMDWSHDRMVDVTNQVLGRLSATDAASSACGRSNNRCRMTNQFVIPGLDLRA
jgi:hypothetical protein